jgi:hypothetical protein
LVFSFPTSITISESSIIEEFYLLGLTNCRATVQRTLQSHDIKKDFGKELRGRGWSPGRVKNYLFPTSSRPVVGSTLPPMQFPTATVYL